jgi:hypothetical protein
MDVAVDVTSQDHTFTRSKVIEEILDHWFVWIIAAFQTNVPSEKSWRTTYCGWIGSWRLRFLFEAEEPRYSEKE